MKEEFTFIGWNIGAIVMTTTAYILRDWVHMQVSFAFIATFILIFYFVVSSISLTIETSTR